MCCHHVVEYVILFSIIELNFSLNFSGDRPTPVNHIPTSILSSTTINTNPILIPPTTSLIKNEQYPQLDLNLNLHHLNHLVQQQQHHHHQLTSDQNDDDDDEDVMDQNTERNSELSNR